MNNPFSRDIPKGAAAAIVALALAAGVVTGREPSPPLAPATPLKAPAPETAVAPIEELDVKRLSRLRSERDVQDLFAQPASRSSAPIDVPTPIPVAVIEPVPPPTAPPLPFTYLGRMTKGDQVIVYLLRNQEMLIAEAGTALDHQYLLESISDASVQFLYLPLGTKQSLLLSAAP